MASTTIASIRKKQAPAMRDLRRLLCVGAMMSGFHQSACGQWAGDLLRAIRELDAATKRRRV
jgi:hypothetical protein